MKKLKYILISIISAILIVAFIGSVIIFATSEDSIDTTNTTDFPEKITLNKLKGGYFFNSINTYGYQVSANFALHTDDDVYCVQQGASTYERVSGLSFSAQRHTVREIVKIKGNIAQWYTRDSRLLLYCDKGRRKMVRIRG